MSAFQVLLGVFFATVLAAEHEGVQMRVPVEYPQNLAYRCSAKCDNVWRGQRTFDTIGAWAKGDTEKGARDKLPQLCAHLCKINPDRTQCAVREDSIHCDEDPIISPGSKAYFQGTAECAISGYSTDDGTGSPLEIARYRIKVSAASATKCSDTIYGRCSEFVDRSTWMKLEPSPPVCERLAMPQERSEATIEKLSTNAPKDASAPEKPRSAPGLGEGPTQLWSCTGKCSFATTWFPEQSTREYYSNAYPSFRDRGLTTPDQKWLSSQAEGTSDFAARANLTQQCRTHCSQSSLHFQRSGCSLSNVQCSAVISEMPLELAEHSLERTDSDPGKVSHHANIDPYKRYQETLRKLESVFHTGLMRLKDERLKDLDGLYLRVKTGANYDQEINRIKYEFESGERRIESLYYQGVDQAKREYESERQEAASNESAQSSYTFPDRVWWESYDRAKRIVDFLRAGAPETRLTPFGARPLDRNDE